MRSFVFVAASRKSAANFLHFNCGALPSRRYDGSGLRLQLRKQDDVTDAFLAKQHHAQTVDAHAHAASGRHAVFKGDEKIFVELLVFAAGLVFQTFALLDGIVLLGVGGRDFLAVDAALEDLHRRRVFGRELRQRN